MNIKHLIIAILLILGFQFCVLDSDVVQKQFYPVKYWSRQVSILSQECSDLRERIYWLSAYDFHLQEQDDDIRDCKIELKVYEDELQIAKDKLYEAQLRESGGQP